MRWDRIILVTLVCAFIFGYEWPRMKGDTRRDKSAFTILLIAGWMLSLFDLPNLTGPISWFEGLLKPFTNVMEKYKQ